MCTSAVAATVRKLKELYAKGTTRPYESHETQLSRFISVQSRRLPYVLCLDLPTFPALITRARGRGGIPRYAEARGVFVERLRRFGLKVPPVLAPYAKERLRRFGLKVPPVLPLPYAKKPASEGAPALEDAPLPTGGSSSNSSSGGNMHARHYQTWWACFLLSSVSVFCFY